MAYCHFELCRDCGLGCFSESLLAAIRRLSVVAVVFLYQITVFLQQNTTASLLKLYFNDSMQTVYARGGASVAVNKERPPMGRWGRCSIYRNRLWLFTAKGHNGPQRGQTRAQRTARNCNRDGLNCQEPQLRRARDCHEMQRKWSELPKITLKLGH